MGRVSEGDEWVILETSGTRTLPLLRSLRAAGLDAWAPVRTERRKGRGKKRNEVVQVELAILPQVVFVRAEHRDTLLAAERSPINPHPAFRCFRDRGAVPAIADRALNALRAAEERFRRSHLKTTKVGLTVGTTARMKKGGFAGMSGTVKIGRKGKPVVDLGGIFGELEISSYLVGTDVVQEGPVLRGLAA